MASNDLRRAAQLLEPIIAYLDGGDLEGGLPTSALHQAVEAARLIEAAVPSKTQQPIIAKSMIEETVGDVTFRVAAETPDDVIDLMMLHKRTSGHMSAEQWERWLAEKGVRDAKRTVVSGDRRNGVSQFWTPKPIPKPGEWVEPPPDNVDVTVWSSGFPDGKHVVTVEPDKTYEFTVGDQSPGKVVAPDDLRLPPLTLAGWTYRQWCLGVAVACAMGSALFGLYYWITVR